jgi:hypothetical protein
MQPIEVTARFDSQGKLIPLQVVQQGQAWRVDAIGRRWQDEVGQHILVMLPGERTVELIYRQDELRWYVKIPSGRKDARI